LNWRASGEGVKREKEKKRRIRRKAPFEQSLFYFFLSPFSFLGRSWRFLSRSERKSRMRRQADEDSGMTWANVAPLFSAVSLFVAVGAAALGMERLKTHVYSLPEYNPLIRVELDEPPAWVDREGWRPRILASIHLPEDQPWLDEMLVRSVADQVNRSGWVSLVERVSKSTDGTISITCVYRRPIAMLRTGEGFVPVDRDGIRLPTGAKARLYTVVDDDSGWLKIDGVRTPPPDIGEPFTGEDAVAGIQIAALIFDQDFSTRISRIDVQNFRGRINKREDQIRLLTRDGGRIHWGSAIGEEIEEPTARDKIRNIALYFQKGSPQAQVDISIYRHGWIETPERTIRTADGSTTRGR
jgi:hypothetical protein